MSARGGDPDLNVNYFRGLEDRISTLERRINDQTRQSSKEVRIRSSKKLSSLMVLGDSIANFDRNTVATGSFATNDFFWTKGAASQIRWQDQLAEHMAGIGGYTRFTADSIGPFNSTQNLDNSATPNMTTVGNGALLHWDYSIPGMSAAQFRDYVYRNGGTTSPPFYAPPKVEVDLLVLYFGVNDWMQDQDPAAMVSALQTLISAYTSRYVCIVVPWQVRVMVGNPSRPWDAYRSALHGMASSKIMVTEPVVGLPPTGYLSDGIHATQDGHNAIYVGVRDATNTITKDQAAQVNITGSKLGAVVETGVVVGNWLISVSQNNELIATDLQSNRDYVLAPN